MFFFLNFYFSLIFGYKLVILVYFFFVHGKIKLTYLLTNLDSGLSNLTAKMLISDPLCQNSCILFVVIYSCSPRKTLSILELDCVKTRIISNERFKIIQHIPYCIHTTVFGTIILLRNYCFFQLNFIFIH